MEASLNARKYSWWWDSHTSPKNSKWLQENLTDMDVKVKHMIKLIEEDADSFARRAEMYYKKRPELMKLVEDFYRAYRALAERYDHATGALRQAHRTMAEAFPNQIPITFADDSPTSLYTQGDPHTLDMASPLRVMFDTNEKQKDASGLSSSVHCHTVKRNRGFTEEPAPVTARKGLKELNELFGSRDEGRNIKVLDFHDTLNSSNVKTDTLSEFERVSKAESESSGLQNILSKLEAEKEACLVQYQQNLERLSNLESKVSHAQDESTGLKEKANKTEVEVQTLKDDLTKLETEREASRLQYQQCVDKISSLENSLSCIQKDVREINERASKAETETRFLKEDLSRAEREKESVLLQYKQCLEMISNLEEKLFHAVEESRRINEQADIAEAEVENLRQTLFVLTIEKETLVLQYQQCLETISNLENKLSCAQEDAIKLNHEIEDRVTKLEGVEGRCVLLERSNQTLHCELESSVQKLDNQSQELTDKQKELRRLWLCIQEERLRFMEAKTAFHTLKHLHSQSQEELRSISAELQNRVQFLKDMETRNQVLQDEVHKVKEENKSLNELHFSTEMLIKHLEDDTLTLKKTIEKLEAEVELRADERNTLQQEICCLKEELNDLGKKHQAVMEQVESVGLAPDCLGLFVKGLQEDNSDLKDVIERERSEKVALMEKTEIMERLIEKNNHLENSLSDLNVELERTREKMDSLEKSRQFLLEEKCVLISERDLLITQLRIETENLVKLTAKTNSLESSLCDTNVEIEALKTTLTSMEASYLLLRNEKSGLSTERESLVSQLDITRKTLEDLEKGYTELVNHYVALEQEKEATLRKVEDLRISLDTTKQEYATFVTLSETHISNMDLHIRLLQEENQCRKKEYEGEQDKALNAQIETFILQKCIEDLEENNISLSAECQKIMEASQLSEKLISNLKFAYHEQQAENKSLFGRVKLLRMGLQNILKRLEIDAELNSEDKIEYDQNVMHDALRKVEDVQNSNLKIQDENAQLVIENFVLIALFRQLKREAEDLATERITLTHEFELKCEQLMSLQRESQNLIQIREELELKVEEGVSKEELMMVEIGNFHQQLLDLQGTHKDLHEDHLKEVNEKKVLMKSIANLEEENHVLENEISGMLTEVMSQTGTSLIFKNFISKKFLEINELNENLVELHSVNDKLEEKVQIMERKLKDVKMENSLLKESIELSRTELFSVKSITDQLSFEVASGKELVSEKEMELFEAERMLTAGKNERTELCKTIEDLKCKYDEVKVEQEDQEKKILKLLGDYDHQYKDTELATALKKLCEEIQETKQNEEKLSRELLKARNEVELWESQSASFFGELQVSSVHEIMLEGRACELTEACESLDAQSTDKDREIERLKDKVSTLEGENKGLNAQLDTYVPAIISLKDNISSLEKHTILHAKLHQSNDEVTKDSDFLTNMNAESCPQTSEEDCLLVPNGVSDLQKAQSRIKTIGNAVTEMERVLVLEISNANSKLEAAMRQIEGLKSTNDQAINHVNPKQKERELDDYDVKQKHTHKIHDDRNEVTPKDIMLDQISECSSYGISRRETLEVVDYFPSDYHHIEEIEDHRSRNPSVDSLIETELGMDTLEISKRFTEFLHQEGNKRKMLERLESDKQKLTNLQITVQDLKKKVGGATEKGHKKGKTIEHDIVKRQLEEVGEAIIELFDVNRELIKNVENRSLSFNGNAAESDESASIRRRRISEQTRRGSERIEQLQIELQNIQFLLPKLDKENERRTRIRMPELKSNVLLQDYFYGNGVRTNQRGKKKMFCSCVRPPTND